MSILPASGIGDESTGFYPVTIDQSLRFQSAHLARTPSSASNQKTWTFSCWFKIGNTGANHTLWSAGATGTPRLALYLSSGGQLITDIAGTGSYDESVARFRDTTNWYHLVWAFDTTQATGSNRSRMYINGTEITLTKTRTFSQDTNYAFNGTVKHTTGGLSNSTGTFASNLYLAEVNFVDGTQLTPTSFGETKNGVWIPKAISGLTYSTNGFRLTFADSSSIGDDTSGNTNDFSTTALASTDVMLDSPTNNFCVMNPLQKGAYIDISEGNLKVAGNSATNSAVALGTFAQTSGKWYFEVRQGAVSSEFIGVMVKQVSFENSLIDGSSVAQTHGKGVVIRYNGNVRGISGELQSVSAFTYTATNIIGIAFDMDNGAVYFAKNNTWLNSGDPTSGSSKTGSFLNFTVDDTRIATPALDSYTGGAVIANFGADSSFAGNATAQGNSDENGQGDFYYTPPSGYLALCSSNLSDTTLSPNKSEQADDYFITTTYSGDSNNSTQISTGFQPDWVWIKNRTEGASDGSGEHMLYDSSRGVHDDLNSNNTSAEDTNTNGFQEFGSTFFRPGSLTRTNETGDTYVGWNWKANGGTTSSNTQGSKTSTVQANTTAGFSIVLYSGDTSSFTVGHGLSSAPEWVIVKSRTHAERWAVFHTSISDQYIYLSDTFAGETSNADERFGNSTSVVVPNSTVVTLGANNSDVSKSGENYVMYCFHSVEGYSKFGSYTGNNSTDGTYVFLGFRPAWIMIKATAQTESWGIHDNKRNTVNVVDDQLLANVSNAENAVGTARQQLDFLSNGFKMRNAGDANPSINNESTTYIYMAFAEQPFKFSNAR